MTDNLGGRSSPSCLRIRNVAGQSIDDTCIERRSLRRHQRGSLFAMKIIRDDDVMKLIRNDQIAA